MERRQFIRSAAASLALWHTGLIAKPLVGAKGQPKLIWLVLRGALDSLETVIPAFDQQLGSLRPTIKLAPPELTQKMQHGFVLHPSLKHLYSWYQKKQLLPIVAVGSGFAKRSHFDGQDYLESGLPQTQHDNGWLARAITLKQHAALAVSQSTPISLRGSGDVNTWFPTKLKHADQDLYQTLSKMYQHDDQLSTSLSDGLAQRALTMGKSMTKKSGKFAALAKGCGQLMAAKEDLNCAMLEMGGWDTHNNQNNRLARQLSELDNGLAKLKESLGKHWDNTVVVVATEFGRTAKENGTKGTDHGTASAMLLAGGAIAGGRVLGQWPGLSTSNLFEQRDLQPTSYTFSWLATLLNQHWQIPPSAAQSIFDGAPLYKEQLVS